MIINQFWYGPHLPEFTIESMHRIKRFGYSPVLWTYAQDKPKNIPTYVTVKDANTIIPFEYFNTRFLESKLADFNGKTSERKKYHAIVFLSDMFRARLLYLQGGWWFDTDVILLKKLPTVKEIVSTNPRKLQGVFARKQPHFKEIPHGDVNSSVMKAIKGSSWMKNHLSKMTELVEHHYSLDKPLRTNIELLLILPTVLPKGIAAPPIMFNPLAVWTAKTGVTSFGYKIPSLHEVKNKSYTLSLTGSILKSKYKQLIKQLDDI